MTQPNPEHVELLKDRAALELELLVLQARAESAERKWRAFRTTPWGIIGDIIKDALRRPWRVPRLLAQLFRFTIASRRLDPNLKRGDELFAEKRYDEALDQFEKSLARTPGNLRALQRKRDALVKLGALSGLLETVREMQAVGDIEVLRRMERSIEGRLRELDPTWLPELPGRPEQLTPASSGKVLHILKHSLPYQTNGYTVRSRYTLRAQKGAGLDPVAVTSLGFPRLDGIADVDPVEMVDGIAHHRLDLGPDFPYKAVPLDEALSLSTWLTARLVEHERPAIIHARSGFRGYETVLSALALGRRYEIPVVYEISSFLESTWTADVEWAERGELYEKRFAQEVRCMNEVDHVVTIADSMRDEIIARGIDPAKVTVIPNAVDPAGFEPRAGDPALVRSLGLEGKVVLGYISNLGAREGIDVLIEATALLRSRGLPVACVIVGEGPERAALQQRIQELGVGDVVTMVGAVPHDNVNDYYALIDIFVIPRKDDRAARWVTPLKPFEAMAMGKALIVSSLPALVEICDPDTRGLAFDVGDAADLAQKAELLINDPERRRAVGEEARAWVLRERTWDKNGERYRALYETVIAQHAPRVPAASSIEQPVPTGDIDELRTEMAALETQADELRARAAKAERAFRTSRWRRARGALVKAGRDPRALLSLARRVPTVVRRARGQAAPSSTMGGKGPRLAARSAGGGSDPTYGDMSLLEYGMQALRFFASRNGDSPAVETPVLMAYWPLVRNNPYQEMLYGHCWNHGIAPLPIADLSVLEDVPALRELGAEFWLHVHWTGAILAKAQTRADARAAYAAFVSRLDGVVNAGGRIVWTVHNVLPHERTFEDLEVAVSEALAERASVIHVLCGDTPALTEHRYKLPPEKLKVVPHSSYLGVYPNVVDKSQARFALGLLPNQTVLAFIGGIRPYKGLDALLDAYQPLAREDPDLRLIVAGPPIDFPNLRLLRRRCEADPSIITRMTRIPETELQLYFNAADAIVLPYTDILNSGALMLALSYGRPVIAANRGCVGSLVSEDVGLLFDPATPGDLARVLRRAPELKDERFSRAALRVAESVPPAEVAERFARLIREETDVAGRAASR